MPVSKDHQHYDLVVIGGGPAGLTAALYGGRARLKTLVIEKGLIGGLATYTNEIANYPGFPEGITGLELAKKFEKQARHFGAEFKNTPVKRVDLTGRDKVIETFRTVYHAKAVIIATGGKPRLLGVPGEESFLYDKGISFCATCDAASCKDKVVMVIGSGDAAVEEGLFLTKFASKVIMSVIHEEGHMDANAAAQAEAMREPKMEFRWNTVVDHFEGGERLEAVILKDTRSGELVPVPVDRCFYFIGYLPATELFQGQVELTERGYIPTNTRMQTNLDGVFAAGDVRQTCLRQVATAVGDGAIAGFEAERYIAELDVFENQLLQCELPGMIYVYSPIDERSRDFMPTVREIERRYAGRVRLGLVDTYKGECLAARLGAVDTPSLVFTQDGKVVAKTRVLDPARITAALDALVDHREPELAE
ncbi:FAD-dependent oxidoreductase [Rhodoplanes sp. TEM]|uniref:Thioredoxin reductase n=1 Tax=Rhodoplanes tepidamans TaxID=200616 RepID=A0ABT5J717_RHOTP|nr:MULTISPECIES: FAD-dependent oxidoreductase [Rhodoplanes]MDC7785396.1 FAD-dependent oxidoreductase [Rhodoplanes tepidamans]MDC7984355.1 FAD-dependent oxidoreductase [Rhodoplanes sp. TEM]MDQ0353151.1 thioredoxin reductase (NADPH) [Rhodoplanes tepidamans]